LESRVTKYEHRLQEIFNFTRGEIAVLCILLLRGPQTLGELRGRADRMHRFEDLSDVQAALDRLMRRDPPLARTLPRQPGTKEARSIHLLCGDTESFEPPPPPLLEMPPGSSDRIPRLEAELAAVQEDVAELKRQVEKLLKLVE
jgi:uncharacterized protein